MRDFRSLAVWRKAHELVLETYQSTRAFPRDEVYGLTSQMRRAAVSIGANIAEGCGREGDPELARFLRISMGSASELEYHILVAHDLGYLNDDGYTHLLTKTQEVKRMQSGFLSRLKDGGTGLSADS